MSEKQIGGSLMDRLPTCPPWIGKPVMVIRWLLGAMFIYSGMVKVMDAQAFMNTLQLYNLPSWLTPLGALMPPIEVGLGVALLLGIAPSLTALATMVMLAGFSLLLVIAMVGGDLETCGCFGNYLEMSPGWSIVRNVVLMGVGFVLWKFYFYNEVHWRKWQITGAMGLLLILGTYTGYTIKAPQADNSLAQIGDFFPDTDFVGEPMPLDGELLVFLFAANCEHCWNAVNNVKEIANSGILPMVGVTPSADYEIEKFRREFDLDIPIYHYDQDAFFEAFHLWPALYYVRDGIIEGRIDMDVPGLKTLREIYFPMWE